MKRFKVVTVVGTRPEVIRLSETIKRLDSCEVIEHILIHTGQNYDYELNEVFFKDLKLREPDYFLNCSGTPCMTIGNILIKIDVILEVEKPDAFLVLGDTNSCLSAISAKKRHIPIFHMEAGNRCFDQRVPEESNRRIVDHIADINMPYSDIARQYLLREGIAPDRIIKTGSPLFEVLNANMKQIDSSDILERLSLTKREYFVVSTHREENINNGWNEITDILNSIAEEYNLPIIFSVHPRTRHKMEEEGTQFNSLISLLKPLGFHDYIKLQKNAKAVLSDSGTISEESSIMNLKALNIREAHERPEAMEEGTVMMTGLNKERVMQGLKLLEDKKEMLPVDDYIVPNVSEKVLRIILSYTDYIKRDYE